MTNPSPIYVLIRSHPELPKGTTMFMTHDPAKHQELREQFCTDAEQSAGWVVTQHCVHNVSMDLWLQVHSDYSPI